MMRRVVVAMLMVMVVAGAVFAQTATMPVASKDELVTLTGDVIDNMCAGSQTPESLASFVKTHTKECAIAPSCLASGYSIFVDGRLWKFDKTSSDKVGIFLRAADSKLQVVVDAKKTGEELTLVAIRNQE